MTAVPPPTAVMTRELANLQSSSFLQLYSNRTGLTEELK